MNIFSIDYIIITIGNYPMSLVELLGTVSGMIAVYLTAKEKVSCWPAGIINIIFFFIIFFQVQLYSDMLLQIYFLIMSFYGWWMWTHPGKEKDQKNTLKVTALTTNNFIIIISISFFCITVLGSFMNKIHELIPFIFAKPAAYPFVDAFIAVFSIIATVLMSIKKKECWLFWIAVDVVSIVVYFLKGLNLLSVEYIIFGLLAFKGWISWNNVFKNYKKVESIV